MLNQLRNCPDGAIALSQVTFSSTERGAQPGAGGEQDKRARSTRSEQSTLELIRKLDATKLSRLNGSKELRRLLIGESESFKGTVETQQGRFEITAQGSSPEQTIFTSPAAWPVELIYMTFFRFDSFNPHLSLCSGGASWKEQQFAQSVRDADGPLELDQRQAVALWSCFETRKFLVRNMQDGTYLRLAKYDSEALQWLHSHPNAQAFVCYYPKPQSDQK
jgi:hypothetical protein